MVSPAPRRGRARRVLVARPVGRGAAMLRALRAAGFDAIGLPTARIVAAPDARAARLALATARNAAAIVYSSPNAVRAAYALQPRLRLCRATAVLGVGPATVRALARRGCKARVPARRYDSEGLLAHPALAASAVRGRDVLLVGAPGGRGLVAQALARRGARVVAAEVYARVLPRWDRRHRTALATPGPRILVVSSVEAVAALACLAAPPEWTRLRAARAIASSQRVAAALRAAGFQHVQLARSALAADLVSAVVSTGD
jgi:uroporphyrinogen-III synthase